MRKLAVIVVAALGVVALPSGARAGDGGAIAAGVIGGLAIGTLTGAAIAGARPAPSYVYEDYAPRRRSRVYRYYSYDPSYYDDDSGYSYERTYYDPWSGHYYHESWHD